MPRVDLIVKTPVSRSVRVKQLEGMFDVPAATESAVEWHADIPFEAKPWNIGAIVGPSGCGKSSVARSIFGKKMDRPMRWRGASVIDDFAERFSMEQVAAVCQAVGFNTIPAWRRPFAVLSNGEKFRVELARRLLEDRDPVVIDEFTSVVDRQVAQIGANAVRKFIRKHDRQFVAVTCHYDIIEWLQPDWIFEPATAKFAWRSVQPRPPIAAVVSPVPRALWTLFAPYHYLTASLKSNAHCFGAFVGGRLAAFAGMSRAVTQSGVNIMQCNRLVTLPDFQGLGLAFVLIDALGSIYGGIGEYVHTYPAHPPLIRAFDRSQNWQMRTRPGSFSGSVRTVEEFHRRTQKMARSIKARRTKQGTRPNAVFRYVGPALERTEAERILLYFADTEGRYGRHQLLHHGRDRSPDQPRRRSAGRALGRGRRVRRVATGNLRA